MADSQAPHSHDHDGHHHGHGHAHGGHRGHTHAAPPDRWDRAFAIGIGLNVAYVLAEATTGLWTGSVALLPYGALTTGCAGKELAELGLLKEAGAIHECEEHGWMLDAADPQQSGPCVFAQFPRGESGAMTSTSCPVRRRCSITRSTELVTPLTFGRKDSATIATRTSRLSQRRLTTRLRAGVRHANSTTAVRWSACVE